MARISYQLQLIPVTDSQIVKFDRLLKKLVKKNMRLPRSTPDIVFYYKPFGIKLNSLKTKLQ